MAEGVDVAHGSPRASGWCWSLAARGLDHRRRTQLGDFTLVIAELGENRIGVLAEHRRRQGALVAGAVDEHWAMNSGDLAFARMALPVERAQMAHLRIVKASSTVFTGPDRTAFFSGTFTPWARRLVCTVPARQRGRL